MEVCAGIKGTNRGCWGAVFHLEVTRHLRPCSWWPEPTHPQPELAILPFLTCRLLLMFLPLLVTTFLLLLFLFFIFNILPIDLHPARFCLCPLQEALLHLQAEIGVVSIPLVHTISTTWLGTCSLQDFSLPKGRVSAHTQCPSHLVGLNWALNPLFFLHLLYISLSVLIRDTHYFQSIYQLFFVYINILFSPFYLLLSCVLPGRPEGLGVQSSSPEGACLQPVCWSVSPPAVFKSSFKCT